MGSVKQPGWNDGNSAVVVGYPRQYLKHAVYPLCGHFKLSVLSLPTPLLLTSRPMLDDFGPNITCLTLVMRSSLTTMKDTCGLGEDRFPVMDP